MKRYACRYCDDYAAEFADLSFGGIGAPEGWTTVMARIPLGRAILADAKGTDLEQFNYKDNPRLVRSGSGQGDGIFLVREEKAAGPGHASGTGKVRAGERIGGNPCQSRSLRNG